MIGDRGEVARIDYCSEPNLTDDERYNIVTVQLGEGAAPDLRTLERHFYTTSACGVCGKASLDALDLLGYEPVSDGVQVTASVIHELPDALRRAQAVFESTGGLHAAGVFGTAGDLLAAREDVGRHNAVDKLVGWALLQNRLPLKSSLLMVSGRASFEIVQKALRAGIPIVCAVSAPSSLAVAVAERFGMTLVGFVRGRRFNVYAGPERIVLSEQTPELMK